ncbi:hypothetical protein BDV95DRAFT_547126 [Massariosphaeria phaeospora]|uniref:ERCC1-like central domain-containing protein n=1 Tax=Massariosphaeria phaeospora TaxID=100035 RepID=A0A7C8MCJ3_9PLEO|nr:hypothetical protein BDV95DRAFT_547126 [Massariosphaeria phaeospora]
MDDAGPRAPLPAPQAAAAASALPAQTTRSAAEPPTTTATAAANAPKVQQPKPQALPSRSGPSSILVSPRQKGNPILNGVRAAAWEYSDIPADYVLGATTCALFLSLKYHRLHPEYIYNRIRDLKGQYNLRILLVMVDIENHEESLRELSKTSLINNVTIMLCWSAQEAGRYLELFKTFEHAAPTGIRAQQSTSYSDKMVEFITVPRSINKTDAIGLVSNFGSIRTAVNAGPEEVGLIAGWGEKKVQRWCNSVREPFRIKKAAKRGVARDDSRTIHASVVPRTEAQSQMPYENDTILSAHFEADNTAPAAAATAEADADKRPSHRLAEDMSAFGLSDDQQEAMQTATAANKAGTKDPRSESRKSADKPKDGDGDGDMSEGILAALSKLRQHRVDLKSVRSVCTSVYATASSDLFRSVVACARYQALGALQKISLHSSYAASVKEIIFDGSVYLEELATHENEYDRAARIPELQHVDPWHKHQRYKHYQALYREQEEMRTDGILLHTVSKALDWMPNVSSVVYSPGPRNVPVEAKLMKDLVPRGSAHHNRSYHSHGDLGLLDLYGFYDIVGAICMSQYTGIREFHAEFPESNGAGTKFTLDMFTLPNPTHLEAAKFFFSRLNTIVLKFAINSEQGGLRNLNTLLSEAKDLQHMTMHFDLSWSHRNISQLDNYGRALPRLILGGIWSKLCSLSLKGILTDEQQMMQVISRHKDTLASISLKYCVIASGTWANIMDEVLYNTSITSFILDHVQEEFVGVRRVSHMPAAERSSWQYEGQLRLNSNGDRYLDEPDGASSVYRSRSFVQV